MGLMDRRQALLEEKAAGRPFLVKKNKGGINATLLEEQINQMWRDGYELSHDVRDGDGDTLLVFRKRTD